MNKPKKVQAKPAKKHPVFMTLVVGAVIFAVGYFFYVAPAVKVKQELDIKDILTLEVELGKKQTRLFSIKSIAKDFDDLPGETLERLNNSLPAGPRAVDLLANIAGLVEESGLDPQRISIKPPEISLASTKEATTAGLEEISIEVKVDGISYTNLKNIIRNLESNLRLLQLDNFVFDPKSTTVDFTLKAFYFEG